MLRNIFAATLIAAATWTGGYQPGHAQQTGGIVIDLPEIRNYASLGVGVVPDYMGSDDYTAGIAPAGLMKFGTSERYARLLATELSVNVLDSDNAARSGLTEFNAGSGLRDVRIPVMAVFSLSPKWHIAGGLIYSEILDDASDSPIVDERGSSDQLFAGLGVAYALVRKTQQS